MTATTVALLIALASIALGVGVITLIVREAKTRDELHEEMRRAHDRALLETFIQSRDKEKP